jgi:hypothetical protein
MCVTATLAPSGPPDRCCSIMTSRPCTRTHPAPDRHRARCWNITGRNRPDSRRASSSALLRVHSFAASGVFAGFAGDGGGRRVWA